MAGDLAAGGGGGGGRGFPWGYFRDGWGTRNCSDYFLRFRFRCVVAVASGGEGSEPVVAWTERDGWLPAAFLAGPKWARPDKRETGPKWARLGRNL